MKILYIYREYKDRRKRFGNELIKLGNDVTFCDLKKQKPSDKMYEDIDILWFLNVKYAGEVISFDKINELRKRGIKTVVYNTIPVGKSIKEIKKLIKYFDYPFINNERFSKIFDTYYIPFAFYKEDYYPIKMKKTINVSFAGHPQTMLPIEQDERVKWLKQFPEVEVYGKKICERLGIKIRQYSGHKFQRELYNKSKVNLDLPFINSSLYSDILHLKNRFFEIPACKGLLVTHYSVEFDKLLEHGKEALYYSNIEDLKRIIKFVTNHSEEYDHIREAGYKRVMKEHQFCHRFKKMMEIICS